MSFFDSRSAPKWQHTNPQVREEAIALLDDEEILLILVKSDPEPRVRSAALSRIQSPNTLDALIETLEAELLQQAREQRLAQLLPQEQQLANIMDDALLLRIASLTSSEELASTAIARMATSDARMDAAIKHPLARVRLSAARSISDISLLQQLMLAARDHDRGVFRHCKQQLDEHHARQKAELEQLEKLQHLGEKIRVLAESELTPDFSGQLQALKLQWKTIESTAHAGQKSSIEADLARCAERIATDTANRATETQADAAKAAARQEVEAALLQLQELDGDAGAALDESSAQQMRQALDGIVERWQAAQSIAQATASQAAAFNSTHHRWRTMLDFTEALPGKSARLATFLEAAADTDGADYDALRKQIDRGGKLIAALPWPAGQDSRRPALLVQVFEARDQLQQQLGALEKNQAQHASKTQAAIDALSQHLDENHTREADRALTTARRILVSLAPGKRQHFEQLLKPLAARLHEVHDWQGFAIEPKKVELCASMKALIGSQEEVEMLALKIQSLQDEWKALGALPHAREHSLWLEFKAAGDEAWKPCKAAFSAQARLQRENFKRRMELVTQLTAYETKMAWPGKPAATEVGTNVASGNDTAPAPDWNKVQATLDTARAAFSAIKPLNPRDERSSQKAFREVCDRIYDHIKDEYGRNIERKTSLVNQAQGLVTAEDLAAAIESAKKLQRDWKAIGITPVGVDRKLWKDFRAACDAVFARLEAQRTQNLAEVDAQVKQAEALLDQARTLVASEGGEQNPSPGKALAEIRQQFQQIALPAAVQQRLVKEFQTLERQVRDRADALRVQQELNSWTHLQEKMRACALKNSDAELAKTLWEKPGALPKGIDAAALAAWWEQGPSSRPEDEWRDGCIALEIAAGVDSPPADKQARMNYQMRRLAAGMRGEKPEPGAARLNSINAFIALQPSLPWLERFCTVLNASKP